MRFRLLDISFLLLPAFVFTSLASSDITPKDALCSTLFTSLICVCKNREDFQLTPIYDDDITQITVKGCGTVIVTFGVFNSLQIEELEFSDIDTLNFTQFSMSAVWEMMTFKLENISLLNVQPHSFIYFSNVDFISFKNVTVDVLPQEAFSPIFNVKYLLIEKSSFNLVESASFSVQNISTFHVIDSQFNSLLNDSISIQHADEILFKNCTFLKVGDSAFVTHTVDSISFDSCTFETLGSTFIKTTDVQVLNISNCMINTIKTDAFDTVDEGKIVFENNTIKIAYPNSLSPFFTQIDSDKIEYCCNYYACDCNMFWIWDYQDILNPSILKNSKCIRDPTKDLSLYTPVLDPYNNCLSLRLTLESDTMDNDRIISKLPIQFKTSEASIVCLNFTFCVILYCLMLTLILRKAC